MKAQKTITVKTDEENPESVEIIADSIIKIANAVDKMNKSLLSKKALILLIQANCETKNDYSKMGMREVEIVLDSIYSLRKAYIKDLPKK